MFSRNQNKTKHNYCLLLVMYVRFPCGTFNKRGGAHRLLSSYFTQKVEAERFVLLTLALAPARRHFCFTLFQHPAAPAHSAPSSSLIGKRAALTWRLNPERFQRGSQFGSHSATPSLQWQQATEPSGATRGLVPYSGPLQRADVKSQGSNLRLMDDILYPLSQRYAIEGG